MLNTTSDKTVFKEKAASFIQTVNDEALARAYSLVPELLHDGKREGNEWIARNPTRDDENLGSFKINLSNGVWSDFATTQKGGDLVSLFAETLQKNQLDAANYLADKMGLPRFNSFSSFSAERKSNVAVPSKNRKTPFIHIFPLPADIAKPDLSNLDDPLFHDFELGKPQAVYEYNHALGEFCFFIIRYEYFGDDRKKEKEFRPLSYGNFNGRIGWHRKKPFDFGLPFYKLKYFPDHAKKPVLICEGEKAAEAAIKLFGDRFYVIASAFGSKSQDKTDWSSLKGRDVSIWPDNDEGGKAYAKNVAKILLSIGAASVRIVQISDEFPEKWDLANALPSKMSFEKRDELLFNAPLFELQKEVGVRKQELSLEDEPDTESEASKWIKYPYRITKTHLQYHYMPKGAKEKIWINICGRIEILAMGRSCSSEHWVKYLIWKNMEGIKKEWLMPLEMLVGEGQEIIKMLHTKGLEIFSGWDRKIKDYLQDTKPERNIRTFKLAGWQETQIGNIFVMLDRIYGKSDDEEFMFDGFKNINPFKIKGSLKDWQDQIARHAVGNSKLILALSAAFAPPFIYLLDESNGGIHFRGTSSIGKTTIACCAGSVWGGGGTKGYVKPWRATANGLEGVAKLHNDSILCIDEISQADGNDLEKSIYTLFNGVGKERMNANASLRDSSAWRIIVISSGEISLEDKVKEDSKGSKKAKAGTQVRLVDVPADCGNGLGIYEKIPEGFSGGAELSKHLTKASKQFYGVAIHEFLQELIANIPDAVEFMEITVKEMRQKYLDHGVDGQIDRVFGLFALCAAAGELAIKYDVLPWPKGEAIQGVIACFKAWLNARGGSITQTFEEIALIERAGSFFVTHQHGRFLDFDLLEEKKYESLHQFGKMNQRSIIEKNFNHAGYKFIKDDERFFYLEAKVFKEEICVGMNPKYAADILIKLNVLVPDKNGSAQQSVRISCNKRTERKYVFNSKVLELGTDY